VVSLTILDSEALLKAVEKMLRYSLLLFFLLGVCTANAVPVILPDASTSEERTFAADLQNALETTNVSALVSMSYCEDDEPWAVSFYFRRFVEHSCDLIRIVRINSAEAPDYLKQLSGKHSDLPVQWLVVVRQPPHLYEATGTNLTVLPASLYDGRIVISQRMAVFSPAQKRLFNIFAGVGVAYAFFRAVTFLRLRASNPRPQYATAGLVVLLLCVAAECWLVTHKMEFIAPHPLRLLVLPAIGMAAVLITIIYDSWSESGETMTVRLKAAGPLIIFFEGWKAWRERSGPFAAPAARRIVLIALALLAVWSAAYIWRGASIVLSPQHIEGIVTEGSPRSGVHYSYAVNGQQYAGVGIRDSDRTYPVGSPVEVKYSGIHPASSTIDNDPFIFIEQLTCGIAIMIGFALLATAKKRT